MLPIFQSLFFFTVGSVYNLRYSLLIIFNEICFKERLLLKCTIILIFVYVEFSFFFLFFFFDLYLHCLFIPIISLGEFQLRLRQLEKSLLQALNDTKGKILDDDR